VEVTTLPKVAMALLLRTMGLHMVITAHLKVTAHLPRVTRIKGLLKVMVPLRDIGLPSQVTDLPLVLMAVILDMDHHLNRVYMSNNKPKRREV
jgi:hypothetical protein